jgi:hypothetical protein
VIRRFRGNRPLDSPQPQPDRRTGMMIAGSFLRMGIGDARLGRSSSSSNMLPSPLCAVVAHMEFLHLRTSLFITHLAVRSGDKLHRVAAVMV